MSSISELRREYRLHSLSEKDVAATPFLQFEKWWQEEVSAQIDEVNAMTLATASSEGVPAARIVLLKAFSDRGFVFFTNYNSFKGRHLEENPRASLVFFWKELERQVRIMGLTEKLDEKESDVYFESRPPGSQVGAWASPQSQVIESREWLEARENALREQFKKQPLGRPGHWGGYLVRPVSIEFWQGRTSRLHDRIQYQLEENGEWRVERLAP